MTDDRIANMLTRAQGAAVKSHLNIMKGSGVMTELSDIFTNLRRWELFHNERTHPHDVAYDRAGKIAVLIAKRTRAIGDWSVGEGPLKRLVQALQEGRIVEAHVALVVKGTTVLTHASLTDVVANIGSTVARDDGRGPYFWLNEMFKPAVSYRDRVVSEDEPW